MREYTIDGIPFIKDKIIIAMPYMGNKRKLATKILNEIYNTIGDFDTIYDLFGGGGSISLAAKEAGHETHYNELNKGIYNLFKHILSGGSIPMDWVSRDKFFELKDGDDWYSGFVKLIFSFGNDQKSYMYSKKIEELKRLTHEVIVNNCAVSKKSLGLLFGIKFPKNIKDKKTFMKILRDNKVEIIKIEHLGRIDKLKQIPQSNIILHNKSYSDFNIINDNNTIIYCDPPYKDTEKYQCDINHEDFYEWCLEQDVPVFISGYEMPDGFECVKEFEHTSSLSAKTHNKVIERLFWNKKGFK